MVGGPFGVAGHGLASQAQGPSRRRRRFAPAGRPGCWRAADRWAPLQAPSGRPPRPRPISMRSSARPRCGWGTTPWGSSPGARPSMACSWRPSICGASPGRAPRWKSLAQREGLVEGRQGPLGLALPEADHAEGVVRRIIARVAAGGASSRRGWPRQALPSADRAMPSPNWAAAISGCWRTTSRSRSTACPGLPSLSGRGRPGRA